MMNWDPLYNSDIKGCHLILFFAITLTWFSSMSYCFLLMVLRCGCDVVIPWTIKLRLMRSQL